MPVSFFRRGEKLAFAVRFTAAEVERVTAMEDERGRRAQAHRIRIVRDETKTEENTDAAPE